VDKKASHQAHIEDTPRNAQHLQPKGSRKERRDKGKKLIKPRDLVVLLWIAQQYAARLDHVQELLSRMPGRGGRSRQAG
jgi:hypothetical protein